MERPDTGERNINSTEPRSSHHAPWVSHHSVPSWLRPTNLVYVCISSVWNSSVARSLVRTANVVCRSFVSRSTDGDGRDILSRAASCSSCFLHRSSRCLKWSTPAVSSSSDRVPDHLTVGRNLHMKNAGTITSTPGRSVWFSNPRWRVRHMVSNRGHCAVVKPLVRVGSVGTTPTNHCTRAMIAQGFELWVVIERLAEKGWTGENKTPSDKGEHGWVREREKKCDSRDLRIRRWS